MKLLVMKVKMEKLMGVSVAHKIGICEDNVFKTLVVQGLSREIYVFVIPVAKELNLKKLLY